jgi:hypothetical protein
MFKESLLRANYELYCKNMRFVISSDSEKSRRRAFLRDFSLPLEMTPTSVVFILYVVAQSA